MAVIRHEGVVSTQCIPSNKKIYIKYSGKICGRKVEINEENFVNKWGYLSILVPCRPEQVSS
jgi:hypothetical protein